MSCAVDTTNCKEHRIDSHPVDEHSISDPHDCYAVCHNGLRPLVRTVDLPKHPALVIPECVYRLKMVMVILEHLICILSPLVKQW